MGTGYCHLPHKAVLPPAPHATGCLANISGVLNSAQPAPAIACPARRRHSAPPETWEPGPPQPPPLKEPLFEPGGRPGGLQEVPPGEEPPERPGEGPPEVVLSAVACMMSRL